jgi:hypothetical protein
MCLVIFMRFHFGVSTVSGRFLFGVSERSSSMCLDNNYLFLSQRSDFGNTTGIFFFPPEGS